MTEACPGIRNVLAFQDTSPNARMPEKRQGSLGQSRCNRQGAISKNQHANNANQQATRAVVLWVP